MKFKILHTWNACSTLFLYALDGYKNSEKFWYRYPNQNDFINELKESIRARKPFSHLGCTYSFRTFGILLCCTSHHQEMERDALKTLGFDETEDTYNMKNGSYIKIHTIEVKKLLKELNL